MTGLEKMKSQILEEAKAAAKEKTDEAEKNAKELLEAAKAEAAKTVDSISQRSAADIASYEERTASSIDLQKRTKILAAKQEVIAEVLDRAYDRLTSMDEEEYFGVLAKLLRKYARPQEGEIYFSNADFARMSEKFKSEVADIAKEKGGRLNIAEEGRNIADGFVLAYEGIEENCTLKAIFDTKRDELSDKIHKLLFS